MGEQRAIDSVDDPVTVEQLETDLVDLGVNAGEVVLCHSSLSSLGWVCGDAPAVVDALQRVITPDGTIVMPTHTPQYSDPSVWSQPPVPDEWISTIHECRPPFRPAVTPTRGVGAIPECFRNYPDVHRSRHPVTSFAAWGADAEQITADHSFTEGLGDGSPLAAVYDRQGMVLLLGTDHATNTSLHLAELRCGLDLDETSLPIRVDLGDGVREVSVVEPDTSTDDFPDVGTAYEATHDFVDGTVGAARARLYEQVDLVDFAIDWFAEHRD